MTGAARIELDSNRIQAQLSSYGLAVGHEKNGVFFR
jgi:hypothetical protein